MTTMLDELEAEQTREADLYCALVAARHRRAKLARGAGNLPKALPEADRVRHGKRLALIERARRAPRSRQGATARSAAALAWLARHPSGAFTTAELDEALVATGFGRRRGYATKALHRMVGQGTVARAGRGRFRINLGHPELVALRRRAVAEADRGW